VAQLVERLTAGRLGSRGRAAGRPPGSEGLRVKAEDAGPVWQRDKIHHRQTGSGRTTPQRGSAYSGHCRFTGQPRPKQVVTGAPNIKVGDSGQKVILMMAGSMYYDGHSAEKVLKELKPGKVRGRGQRCHGQLGV